MKGRVEIGEVQTSPSQRIEEEIHEESKRVHGQESKESEEHDKEESEEEDYPVFVDRPVAEQKEEGTK